MLKLKKFIYLLVALLPLSSQAGPLESLDTAAAGTGLEGRDLTTMISVVINAILGLLGTIFLVLLIIGGFKWMASRGNTQQIEDAKKTITNAAIGIAIVLASYAISRFIIFALSAGDSGGATVTP